MAKYSAQASNIQSISGTANSVVKSGGVLKPGDSVFVRVLSSLGGQKYSVSFAGNRFSVTSHTNLTPGESFRAQVQFQSGTLLLVPEFSQNATSMGQTISIQNYLATLGLSNDMFSEQLIQLFVGMGIKFNNKRAQRIRTLSAHFPGREKEAAEIALILFEKGIEPDIDTVMQLLA
ncbi:MAG TPA: hypothetical protein VFC68_04290, partial [Treponemataceae bacterium]|nr:hypothetical protein [Treponemataceae bacterium]